MTLFELVVLALVQGVTEFLPISSSGHLLLVRFFLGITDENGATVDAFLHVGTLCAVLAYYWRVWWGMARSVVRSDAEGRDKRELMAKLAVATVPGAIAGYFFQEEITIFFRSPNTLAVSLLVTAAVLWWFDRNEVASGKAGAKTAGDVRTDPSAGILDRADFRDAFLIGLMQVLSLIPGISRSGMTIAGGRWRGLSRKQATTFSFLMSAPIIAGAGLNSLADMVADGEFLGPILWVALLISFGSGLVAIHALLKIVERVSFRPFAIYLVLMAAVVFLWL